MTYTLGDMTIEDLRRKADRTSDMATAWASDVTVVAPTPVRHWRVATPVGGKTSAPFVNMDRLPQ
jgi:hypothetical protein